MARVLPLGPCGNAVRLIRTRFRPAIYPPNRFGTDAAFGPRPHPGPHASRQPRPMGRTSVGLAMLDVARAMSRA